MKIVDVQVIPFRVPRTPYRAGKVLPETTVVQTLTKIITDEGVEGYYLGGSGHGDQDGFKPDERRELLGRAGRFLIGQDPFDREKVWHEMWVTKTPENILSVIDMALWDLQARLYGVPIYKLLGGCRDKVLAYASTWPNMASPEGYAEHAVQCRERGYQAYKIHPYYFADPETLEGVPGRPSHIKADIEASRLIREAVGDDMALMFDPWGTYHTYEDAVWVGRRLQELDYYWYEHPMPEYRVHSYEKLAAELEIPILSPEIAAGSIYTRADWILRDASDMSRIDVLRGGITGCIKTAAICEAFGVKCEMHMAGWGNLQILGATSADVCEYYERGLEGLGVEYDQSLPYLEALCDPMDDEGYVHISQEPGMGYKIIWDYIEENRIQE